MKKERGVKVIALFLTISVLAILLLAGPANAVITGLSVLNDKVSRGQIAEFTAQIEIKHGETLDVDYVALDLSGPISTTCLFDSNATKITSCNGIEITLLSSPNYNYGYGFEEGILKYKIKFNTTNYPSGIYKTKLIVFSGAKQINEAGPDIEILSSAVILESCSIRAKQGDFNLLGTPSGDNTKLSFNIPKGEAVNGEGSLISQYNKKRFSYSFDIVDTIQNDEHNATILVNGKYKINRGAEKEQIAIIHFNKDSGLINIDAQDFSALGLEVNFRFGC